MSLTVYVTGCLGFIGAYVTEACLNQGWHVIGVDKMTYASQPDKLEYFKGWGPNHFKFIESDINDLDRLYDCDYIINCAAETHVDNSIVSSKEFLRSNVNGVHHLLELVRSKERFRIPTLLHFSTDEVYGDITEGSHTEENLLKPSNPYSATKAAADMLILAWNRTFKVPYIIVRPTNNYGIGQYVEKLIPKTCKLLLMGKKIPLHNYGTPTRIWLHAKDTADAVIYIINNKCQNEIFNISGNAELPNYKIVSKIVKLLEKEDDFSNKIELLPQIFNPLTDTMIGFQSQICDFSFHRPGVDVRYSLNDSKLRKLDWKNKCDLDIELPSVVAYYKDKFVW